MLKDENMAETKRQAKIKIKEEIQAKGEKKHGEREKLLAIWESSRK